MRFSLLSSAVALAALPAFGQGGDCEIVRLPGPEASEQVFYVCHAEILYLDAKRQWKPLPGGATIRVPPGKTELVVVGTNTALFDYRLSTEPVDSPEGKQLSSFLKAFGPYLVDVPSTQKSHLLMNEAGAGLIPGITALEDTLKLLDSRIDELRGDRIALLGAFAEDRASKLKSAVRDFCRRRGFSSGGPKKGCTHHFRELSEDLLDAYREVEGELSRVTTPIRNFEAVLSREEPRSTPPELEDLKSAAALQDLRAAMQDVSKVLASARKALDEAGEVLALVRMLERLALDGLSAKATWAAPAFPVSLEKGRKVTLKITPKPVAAVARAGRLPNVDVTFTLQPDWTIRPAVGLSLLYTEDAVHPKFGTSKTKVMEDGKEVEKFRIVEKELEDNRFTYGLTLGLTHRKFCGPDGKSCGWLDFTINPSDDVKALGSGLSWNWGRFRLGAGALWTKHPTLENGLRVDDLLSAEGDLKTGQTYGDPELYLTFSVIGWRPFVPD